ncbi:MAG: hypothetical protein VB877_14740 [Pirellulaceae bacterium]
MKRPAKNQPSHVAPSRRSLRIETLEDRKLMTVAVEMVQLPQESQIGSEHWPEPAAEIAVEKVTNDRLGFFSQGWDNPAFRGSREIGFSRGLHNNGAFQEPTGHVLWNVADDAGTSSNSYTDSGRITYYAYELKNVQVSSVVDQEANPVSNNGDQDVPTDLSFVAGVPSCPEFQAGADIVMEELEHGPGLHDRPGQLVEKLGGQEGEPVTENQFSLNYAEIKVTFADDQAEADEDEDDLPSLGGEDEGGVTDPGYTEDEQGGPADPLNDPRSGTEDQDEENDEPSDDELREVVERLIEVLDII